MKKREPRTATARTDRARRARRAADPERAALGLEAEFVVVLDGEPVDPADAFGDPRAFLGDGAMHRTGTSYHLPTGGAVYFDTGVIEVVTPIVELQPGAPAQAVRSLWEGILAVRQGLDRWADDNPRDGRPRDARLVGFSAHYSISIPDLGQNGRIHRLARLLVHMIPFPVMLLAANPRSTGVGVRPRPGRVEVTVDFTPDPALMTAAAAVIAAAVVEAAAWDEIATADDDTDARDAHRDAALVAALERRGYPVVPGFCPLPHTSRKGWLARGTCFDPDPFRTPPDLPAWRTTAGDTLSLRDAAARVVRRLRPALRHVASPQTRGLVARVLSRRHPSLLDFDDRPATYEDVGRGPLWREPDPRRPLPRSLYEQVMLDAMNGRPLRAAGRRWTPVSTRGWTRIRYRSDDGRLRTFSVDELVRLRGR